MATVMPGRAAARGRVARVRASAYATAWCGGVVPPVGAAAVSRTAPLRDGARSPSTGSARRPATNTTITAHRKGELIMATIPRRLRGRRAAPAVARVRPCQPLCRHLPLPAPARGHPTSTRSRRIACCVALPGPAGAADQRRIVRPARRAAPGPGRAADDSAPTTMPNGRATARCFAAERARPGAFEVQDRAPVPVAPPAGRGPRSSGTPSISPPGPSRASGRGAVRRSPRRPRRSGGAHRRRIACASGSVRIVELDGERELTVDRPRAARTPTPPAPASTCARSRISSTTAGSASVVVSPSGRSSATSRRSRRMILPERVFGSSGVNTMFAGIASLPIFVATCSRSSVSFSGEPSDPALQRDERDDRLAGHGVLPAAHRRLRHVGVIDERALHLDRRDPVPADVHHVVDAAHQPEVAVLVDAGAVAGEVHAREPAPVRRAVAFVVLVEAAEHRRPRPLQHQVAAGAGRDLLAAVVVDGRLDPRERPRRAARASAS